MIYSEMLKTSLKSRETYNSTAASLAALLEGMRDVNVTAGINYVVPEKGYELTHVSSPTAHFEVINFDVGYESEILPDFPEALHVKAKVKRVGKLGFSKELFD